MTKRLVAGVAIAILAALAGFWGYRALVPKPTLIPSSSVSIAPPEKQNREKPVTDQVPDVRLQNRQGSVQSMRDFPQPVLVYNFWATWCGPCRREIPLLKALRRERAAQGLEVIGVAVDFRDQVLKYAAEMGIDYPLLIGEQDGLEALDAFGIPSAFPISVFADRGKRIVAVKLGELHRDEAGFILDTIAELNAGRIELATAKQQISSKLQAMALQRAKIQATAPGT